MEYGWTFDAIDSMTFDQIADALRRGRPNRGIPVSSHEDVMRVNRRVRRVLLGHE